MGELIDSSVIIALERRGLGVTALLAIVPDEPAALASITAAELLTGVHRADTAERRTRRKAFVEDVLEQFPVLPVDLDVARIYARIWAQLAMEGRMIGMHDLLIAATALAHGYTVVTDNVREFERVPGLVVRRPAW